MYPRDLDAGGSNSNFIFGLIIGFILGAGLVYWLM